MRVKLMPACFLAVAATAANAASGFVQIDDLAGVYKDAYPNTLADGEKFTSEHVLEIVKLSRTEAYIRSHMEFYNGHVCGVWGVARLDGDALVYRPHHNNTGEACALALRKKGDRIVFGDADNACKYNFCGEHGYLDGVEYKLSSRRPIRYMKRLQASRQYGEAIAERDAKP
ncbi:MAG TPA: hypothetical protein VHZ29_04425 [Rhizomicrobium sp.]|jgi:hypothetical protein|nr:hypothetical protein [Rhizomicrobium sp.]